MGHPDGRVVAVDVLPSGAGRAEGFDLEVLRIDGDVDLLGLGQDGHGHRGRVDPPAGFGLGHPLDAVDAAFVFEPRIDPLALDTQHDLLEPADGRLAGLQHLGPPAFFFGIAGIHAEKVLGEKRGLVPSGAGPDLQQDVFIVERVLGNEEELQLPLQDFGPGLEMLELGFGHGPHLGIGAFGQDVARLLDGPARAAQLFQLAHERFELGPLD